jgi:hypothetical protein
VDASWKEPGNWSNGKVPFFFERSADFIGQGLINGFSSGAEAKYLCDKDSRYPIANSTAGNYNTTIRKLDGAHTPAGAPNRIGGRRDLCPALRGDVEFTNANVPNSNYFPRISVIEGHIESGD